MQKFELITFPNAEQLAHAVAEAFLDEIETAFREERMFRVALSGGRIAQRFFASIVEQQQTRKISFLNVDFFWADERCVPPDDPESNFRIAQELLFAPLNIKPERIHRVHGEELPEESARLATAEMHGIISTTSLAQPVLDLVLLGMGEDGHVASLFPGSTPGDEKITYIPVWDSPKPPPRRVSLNYPAIITAKQVWVLVSGSGKKEALRESLSEVGKTPLAKVLSRRNFTKILIDNNL